MSVADSLSRDFTSQAQILGETGLQQPPVFWHQAACLQPGAARGSAATAALSLEGLLRVSWWMASERLLKVGLLLNPPSFVAFGEDFRYRLASSKLEQDGHYAVEVLGELWCEEQACE